MRRLVVVGNGNAADAFLRQIQRHRCGFSITVFSAGKPAHEPAWYRTRGIDLRAGVSVVSIDRHARLVLGDDGSRTTFDRLILATGRGVLPAAGLAARTGLAGSGVIVNRSLETSDGHIYAIGDCADASGAAFTESLARLARNLAARLAAEAVGSEVFVRMPKIKMGALRHSAAVGRSLTA